MNIDDMIIKTTECFCVFTLFCNVGGIKNNRMLNEWNYLLYNLKTLICITLYFFIKMDVIWIFLFLKCFCLIIESCVFIMHNNNKKENIWYNQRFNTDKETHFLITTQKKIVSCLCNWTWFFHYLCFRASTLHMNVYKYFRIFIYRAMFDCYYWYVLLMFLSESLLVIHQYVCYFL